MGTVRNLKPTRQVDMRIRMMHLFGYGLLLILVGFFFNTPKEIAQGLWKIAFSPSNLLTDYMALANIGATFVNAGLVTIFSIALLRFEKVEITGPVVSAVLTVSGFALFGKNLFNTIPISLGVYVYGKVRKLNFNTLALSTLFATALGPLVSEIAFGFGLPFYRSIPYAYLAGFLVGFVFSPVANNCLKLHKSFNLYNSGFTAGLLGMFATGILRMFNLKVETVNIISQGNNRPLALVLFILFAIIFLAGYFADGYYPGHYRLLLKHSGLMAGNWIQLYGYGTILMNMSFMGIFCTLYVILSGGILNGPTIGAILSITGFAAAGVHPKNSVPIFRSYDRKSAQYL